MSLVKVSEILNLARKERFGVPAFNIFNYETIAWVIETAEEVKKPVIVQFYPGFQKYIPFSTVTAITADLARQVEVPVGLHLDHSYSYTEIKEAIEAGFPSVMIDASKEDFTENIRQTQEIVKMAHSQGIDVEAELGYVGSGSKLTDYKNQDIYTDPGQVVEFLEKTAVDALAISIGNAHGHYIEDPELDFARLEAISKKVDIPLVLHGGSDIEETQLQKAARLGISKFNIATEYFTEFNQVLADIIKDKKQGSFYSSMSKSKETVKDFIRYKLDLLNE